MIKISAINGAAKKAALGAMLAGSVAMFASNPIKTAKTDTPSQTEVVSKDGAAALKAITFPQQMQTPTVPTVHNKALDEKLLKFADNEEEKKHITEYMSNIYNINGSYLGSAMLQQTLDLNMFLEFLDGNIEILKKIDEKAYNKIDKESMKKVTEKSEPIKKWLNENYFNVYNEPFGQFDHPPDYKEVNDALDDYIKKDPYELFNNYVAYDFAKINYDIELKKSNMDNVQKNSNLIAAKTHTANEILFRNLLRATGFDKNNDVIKNYNEFMDATRAIKFY